MNGILETTAGEGGPRGLVLLEVMVALTLLTTAVVLLLQVLVADLRGAVSSGRGDAAVIRGDERLRELLAEPAALEMGCWEETEEGGRRFEIAVTERLGERTAGLPVRLVAVTLTVRWREGRREKGLTLETETLVERTGGGLSEAPS